MSRHVLMCVPTHYRIAYEINPWMRREHPVDEVAARTQWAALRDVLVQLGVDVELVEQGEDVPDMVFAANAGVVLGRRFLAARRQRLEAHHHDRPGDAADREHHQDRRHPVAPPGA